MFDDAAFDGASVRLGKGDALVLFTDGVSEATRADEAQFTVEGIVETLSALPADRTARSIATSLADRVGAFVGSAPQFDDIAILVVRR